MRCKRLFNKPKPLSLALTSTLLLALGSNITHAMQCDELFQETIDDEYYQLDRPLVDEATYLDLSNLAERLDGRWQGTAIETTCGVSNGETLATVENFDVDADIGQSSGGSIVVRAEKETHSRVQLENLFISPKFERELEKLREGTERRLPSYSVDFSDENSMVFEHKYRQQRRAFRVPTTGLRAFIPPPARVARAMVHEVQTVSLDNEQLTINRDIYVNGYFVSQQEWQLSRW